MKVRPVIAQLLGLLVFLLTQAANAQIEVLSSAGNTPSCKAQINSFGGGLLIENTLPTPAQLHYCWQSDKRFVSNSGRGTCQGDGVRSTEQELRPHQQVQVLADARRPATSDGTEKAALVCFACRTNEPVESCQRFIENKALSQFTLLSPADSRARDRQSAQSASNEPIDQTKSEPSVGNLILPDHSRYHGQIANGKANGQGEATDDRGGVMVFKGRFVDNQFMDGTALWYGKTTVFQDGRPLSSEESVSPADQAGNANLPDSSYTPRQSYPKTVPNVDRCVRLVKDTTNGAHLENICSFRIVVDWCNPDGAGMPQTYAKNLCSEMLHHSIGGTSIEAKSSSATITVPANNSNIPYIACRQDDRYGDGTYDVNWDGRRLSGVCTKKSAE